MYINVLTTLRVGLFSVACLCINYIHTLLCNIHNYCPIAVHYSPRLFLTVISWEWRVPDDLKRRMKSQRHKLKDAQQTEDRTDGISDGT